MMAFSFTGETSIATGSDEYDGCIDLADRTLTSSGSLSCATGVTGTSVMASGGAQAMINSTRLVFVADVIATLFNNTNANTTLAFNSASIIYTTPDTD